MSASWYPLKDVRKDSDISSIIYRNDHAAESRFFVYLSKAIQKNGTGWIELFFRFSQDFGSESAWYVAKVESVGMCRIIC